MGRLYRRLYYPRAGDDPEGALVTFINAERAGGTLDLAFFAFNSPKVVAAIIRAVGRKVTVRMLSDLTMGSSTPSQALALNQLVTAGVPLRIDHHAGLMHLKQAVGGGRRVVLGSYQPTKGARELNDEVMLIIHDRVMARRATEVFERMWGDLRRFGPWEPIKDGQIKRLVSPILEF